MALEELRTAINQNNFDKIKDIIEKESHNNIAEMISGEIDKPDILKILSQIFKAFDKDLENDNKSKKKRKLIELILDILKTSNLTSNHLRNIINEIILTLSKFKNNDLLILVDCCITNMRSKNDESRSWKDLLPKLIELLQDEKILIYRNSSVTGSEYKSTIIKAICSDCWDRAILTSLAEMFRKIIMEKNELETVFRALCEKLLKVDINELPPLVHQMLCLTDQDTKLMLIALCKYFSKKYSEVARDDNDDVLSDIGKNNLKEIQDVESTVLYHIYQATLIKHSRLKEFIKFLKFNKDTPEYVLDPFFTSVLLLTSDIHPEVLEILKSAIIRKVQDETKSRKSIWLRKITLSDWSIMEVMSQIIINSDSKDRQFVLKGLIQFAFTLMVSNEKKPKDNIHLKEIGSKILQKILRKRHSSGEEIIQRLTTNIIENGTAESSQYIDCLNFVCQKLTMVVLSCKNSIVTLLEHLSYLPGSTCIQIIHAILPLVQFSVEVRDALILILRKSLCSKGTGNREMAVIGFIQLLTKAKISSLNALSQPSNNSSLSSSSNSVILTQATIERQKNTTSNLRNNSPLCQEILCILTKCFSHENEVRLCLYNGMYEVIVINQELSELVTKLLLDRFINFYQTDEEILPPISLEKCIINHDAEMIIQEPIGHLVHALQKIYLFTATENSSVIDKMSLILESLCKRMAKLELEHLEMGDYIELLDDIPTALIKLQCLKLCLTMCEVLMIFRINSWSTESVNSAQNIYSIFKAYLRLVDFIKRITKPKKDSKKKDKKDKDTTGNDTTASGKKPTKNNPITQAAKMPQTIMDVATINRILQLLYQESVPWATEEQSTNLRARADFHYYVFNAFLQLLQSIKSSKVSDMKKDIEKQKEYFSIGKLLYHDIILKLEEVMSFDLQCCILGLECFKELCNIMCTVSSTGLAEFLETITTIERCEGLDAQIREIVPSLLNFAKNSFDDEEDIEATKISIIIMETVSYLVHKMPFEKGNNQMILDCLHEMAKEFDNKLIAGHIAQLLLSVEETINPSGDILNDMCNDICLQLDTVNAVKLDVTRQFKIVNDTTANQMYNIANQAIKQKLLNVEWYLDRLKAENTAFAIGLGEDSAREKLREKERKLCSQLNVIIQMIVIVSNAKQTAPLSDAVFKNAQHLYVILSKFIKYFLAKSTAGTPAFQSLGFITIIKIAGKDVKSNIYNLITYVEKNQEVEETMIDNSALRNKILKETKTIPIVIRKMETFQTDLLSLEKKTKVPLIKYTIRSVNRDFKINQSNLEKGLEKMDVSLSNTQGSTHTIPYEEETDTTHNSDSE